LFGNRPSLEVKAEGQTQAQRWLDALSLIRSHGSPSKQRLSRQSNGSYSAESRSSIEKDDPKIRKQQAIRDAFRDAMDHDLVAAGHKVSHRNSRG